MVRWCPSGSPSVSHSFPYFSPTFFDRLSWTFACHFLFMNIRSSSSVVNFRHFLELCPFWNLNYWKYIVFRSYLLHALTYWADILHMTLFCWTTDQVRVSSIFVGVIPLLDLRILEVHIFPHFSLTCFDIFSCNFAYDVTVLQIKFECRQFALIFVVRILEMHSFMHFFSYMLWHIEMKFCIWLCFTVLYIKFECRQFASSFVGVVPIFDLRSNGWQYGKGGITQEKFRETPG